MSELIMDQLTITTKYHGSYKISRNKYIQICRAKLFGALAKKEEKSFHDNPYRLGPVSDDDWLYKHWEYGYCNGDDEVVQEVFSNIDCDACVECIFTGGAWQNHNCNSFENIIITYE